MIVGWRGFPSIPSASLHYCLALGRGLGTGRDACNGNVQNDTALDRNERQSGGVGNGWRHTADRQYHMMRKEIS